MMQREKIKMGINFVIGYVIGCCLTWLLCYGYMKRFKVDKQFGELIYLKKDALVSGAEE